MTLKQRLLYPFAKKFFAGVTLEDAVARARHVNTLGMGATLDFLGEDVSDSKEADAAREGYARTIDAIAAGRLDAAFSRHFRKKSRRLRLPAPARQFHAIFSREILI